MRIVVVAGYVLLSAACLATTVSGFLAARPAAIFQPRNSLAVFHQVPRRVISARYLSDKPSSQDDNKSNKSGDGETKKPLITPPPSNSKKASSVDPSKITIKSSDGTETSLQTISYVCSSIGYASIAAIIVFMPDKTKMAKLATKWGGAAGFAIAAVLNNVLAGASSRQTLSKDAYKKLNLGLLAFSVTGILAVPGESAFTPVAVTGVLLAGFMSMMRIVGGFAAYSGWRAGVKNKNVVLELVEGTKKTQESLDLEKSSKGNFYKFATVAVGFGLLHPLLMIARSNLKYDVSLEVSTIARLCLIISMLLTLKDADDSDKLAGKTFVQMNFMLATWSFAVGIGQALSYASGGFNFEFGRAKMVIFSLPFFFKGMKGQKEAESGLKSAK